MEADEQEAALAPLFRALSLAKAGSERAEEVRAMLVRALGAIVQACAVDIGRLIEAGDTSVALVQSEKLWSLLRSAADQGLPQDDLADTSLEVLALFDRLRVKRP
jgi:hypothetical protein